MGLSRRAKYQHGAILRLPSDMIVIHFLNMPSDMISTCRYVLLLTALPGCHMDTLQTTSAPNFVFNFTPAPSSVAARP